MRARAYLSDGKVIVPDGRESDELARRGYGSKSSEGLILEPWEALYLVEKGRIEVQEGPGGPIVDFQELLRFFKARDEWIWAKFLIYRDLRERGYVVKKGFGPGLTFRLYDRGDYGKKPAKFLVYGILEGSPVKVSDLEEAMREAQASDKELILAVVERRGEVIYYSLGGWIKPSPAGRETS